MQYEDVCALPPENRLIPMIFKRPLLQADDHDLQEALKIHTLLSPIDSFKGVIVLWHHPSGAQHLSFKAL